MNPKLIQAFKAQAIRNNLGTRAAAGYLRNRGWSIEAALWILCKTSSL